MPEELTFTLDPFLTMSARSALFLAAEEARALGAGHVGTEHILLGLMRETQGVAAQALDSLGISFDAAAKDARAMAAPGTSGGTNEAVYSPRARKLVELSLQDAVAELQSTIDTHHLLLAFNRLGEGGGFEILRRAGVGSLELAKAVVTLLEGVALDAGGTISLPYAAVDLKPSDARGLPAGEILVMSGLITSEQLEQALDQARRSEELIGRTLVNLGLIKESDLVRALALQVGLEFIELSRNPVNPPTAQMLPPAVAWRYLAIPVEERDGKVVIAIADSSNPQVLEDIALVMDRELHPVVATPSEIIQAIREHLGPADVPPAASSG
jgi:hypothetical protein